MKVETRRVNPALVSIYKDPNQVITLDANFLIPPDREALSVKAIPFDLFRTTWLDPIFTLFPALAIHEAVQDEVVSLQEKAFIQEMLDESIPKITILKDSQLSSIESILRATIEEKIFTYTHYDPHLNNSLDRGEVKTLSYIAAKGLPYFAAHDNNAIRLVEDAEPLGTGLDAVQVIKMYELIYLLYIEYPSLKKSLRFLYKYQYYLTKHEKSMNPEWGTFIDEMNSVYKFRPTR